MHPLFPYTTLVRSGGSLPPDPPPGGSQGVVRMQKLLMAGFWLFLLSLPIHAAAQGRPIEGHQNMRLGMSVAEAVAAEPRARPDDGCPSGRCLGYFDRRFRLEERRGGQEGVSTCRSRWSTLPSKTKKRKDKNKQIKKKRKK